MAQYKLCQVGVIDTIRSVYIPSDPRNSDYQAYLQWFADGGIPDSADPPPVPDTPAVTAQQTMLQDPAFRGLIKVLATQFSMTPAALVAAIKAAA